MITEDRDYTLEEMKALSLAELRQIARYKKNAKEPQWMDLSGVQIAAMIREEIIARLTGTYTEPPKPAPYDSNNGNGNGNNDLVDVLARALNGKINAGLDKDKVSEIVNSILTDYKHDMDNEIKALHTKISNHKKDIIVTLPDKTTYDAGKQHEIFEPALKLLALGHHISLVGPSGSGKTHIANALANALKIPYYFMAVGPETSKADFFGFRSMGDGTYHSTPFFEAYTKGGLILVDEIDAGHGGVMTMLNGALDNGSCSFPCGIFEKHKDFRCIVSGNTYGRGADKVYVGRNALDGATLERFDVVTMDYDKELEKALCPNSEWCKKMHVLRVVVSEHKAKIIVSMRAILKGAELLSSGFTEDQILDMIVFKGYNRDAVSAIKADWKGRC